ncbi:MAG TPA: Hsp70 family protein [Pseudonocardiaceae bacterium]|nr:Hsp70 family protein [Pseudonocardiaceae bacterium]
MSGYTLSIDIGTTNTVAALSRPGRSRRAEPRLLDAHGHPWVPSAVYLHPGRGLLTGVEAMRMAKVDPSRFEPHPKLHVDDGALRLGGTTVPIMDVLSAIIGGCVERAVRLNRGRRPDALVLTYPLGWGSLRRLVLRRAGYRFARTVHLVAEPLAAAARLYTLGAVAPRTTVVVYDLGGGSLDVAAVGEIDGQLAVLASDGRSDLSGNAFDEALLQLAMRRARIIEAAGRTVTSLREDVRLARESLPVDYFDIPLPPPLADVHLTGAELEAVLEPLLRRTVEVLAGVVAATGMAEPVVLLAGGASRMPQCTALIRERLGVEPLVLSRREAAACLGALTPGLAGPADEPVEPGAASTEPEARPTGSGSGLGSGSGSGEVPAPPRRRRWRRRILLLTGLVTAIMAASAVAVHQFLPGDGAPVSSGEAQRLAREAIPLGAIDGLAPEPHDGMPIREGFRPDASSLLCTDGTPPAQAEAGGRLAAAGATLVEQRGPVRRVPRRLELGAVYLTEAAAEQLARQVSEVTAGCVRDGTGGLAGPRLLADELDVPPGRAWTGFTGVRSGGPRPVRITCLVEIAGQLGLRSCATTDQGQIATTLLAVRGLNAMYEQVARRG